MKKHLETAKQIGVTGLVAGGASLVGNAVLDYAKEKAKEKAKEVAAKKAKELAAKAVQAGLRDRFGFGFTTNHSKNYRICSELVYDAFNGRIGSDVSSSVSPGRLAQNKHLEKTHTLKLSIDAINRVKTLFKHSKRT